MEKKISSLQFFFMLLIFVLAFAGVVLQFYIVTGTWQRLGLSSVEGTVRFFSYFTILTNILVAINLMIVLLFSSAAPGKFFFLTSTQTAINVYIFVVGMVYNLILRKLWAPEGLQLIVDNILHTVVPLLYLIYWLFFVKKETMKLSNAFKWLAYPAGYLLWVLILGAIINFYPYPFVDVNVLGYPKMVLNAGILLVVFLLFSFSAITIKKYVGKTTSRH